MVQINSLCLKKAQSIFAQHIQKQLLKSSSHSPHVCRNPVLDNEQFSLLVRTCRLVGTDNYLPVRDVEKRYFYSRADAAFIGGYHFPYYLRQGTDQLVDISYQEMHHDKNNIVYISDLELLSPNFFEKHEYDVVRLFLNFRRGSANNYFSPQNYLECGKDFNEWLDSLVDTYERFGSQKRNPTASSYTEYIPKIITRKNATIRRVLKSLLFEDWNPSKALHYIKEYFNYLKPMVDKGIYCESLLYALRDLCIYLNLFIPNTSQTCWNILETECETTGSVLADQEFPTDLDNLLWPVRVYIKSSSGYIMHYVCHDKPSSFVDHISEDKLLDLAKLSPSVIEKFGNSLQVERVHWYPSLAKFGIVANIIVEDDSLADTQT